MAPHSEFLFSGHKFSSDEPCLPLQESSRPSANGTNVSSPYLPATAGSDTSELDLICVGFGPASLAIAIALHDALAAGHGVLRDGSVPRVLFLEKQAQFAWHAGMLLPGAKMQISFIKDLATLRDPRSEFTFLNYLHRNGRLVDFTNLGTFLPDRAEFEDYLRWSASHFHQQVQYGREVLSISPEIAEGNSPVRTFVVRSRNIETGQVHLHRGRRILLATGGRPSFPEGFPDPESHPSIIHSSQFAHLVPKILPSDQATYRVAVVGAGQSAAEIFHNTQKLYPNSKTYLIMRQEFLRPSDDSPFVNSVFNPEYIDTHFPRSAERRHAFLGEAKATNYGVVRLELIEALYETMYHQKRHLGRDQRAWPHRILGQSQITSIVPRSKATLEVKVQRLSDRDDGGDYVEDSMLETLEVDLLIAATGYQRDTHVEMLRGTWDMLPEASPANRDLRNGITGWKVTTAQNERNLAVGRNYQVKFAPGTVAEGSGIWLQGCCEGTHGLSDTLLSVLATRSGEIINSVFGHGDQS